MQFLAVPGEVTDPRLIWPSLSASVPSFPAATTMHIAGWSQTN